MQKDSVELKNNNHFHVKKVCDLEENDRIYEELYYLWDFPSQ